jgi:two-component system CheB/CheR fusion protein
MQLISNRNIGEVKKIQYIPSAEFYSQIIDSLEDYSIITLDNELKINSWSSGSTNIFQYTSNEMIGQPFSKIFIEEDIQNEIPQKEIEVAVKAGRSIDVRWHLCKNGKTFYADGLVFPLKSNEGDLIGFVKILRDITKRKESEEAIKKYTSDLEELNSHKEKVLAILSHDLRSPLIGIIQCAEYINQNYETIDLAITKKLLNEIQKATTNELNMLDYLVEWARIKYVAEVFVPTKIKLNHYVDKVFATLKKTAAINKLELINKISRDCSVFVDEKMLISILHNLVSNAIKHSTLEGIISISAIQNDKEVVVEIKIMVWECQKKLKIIYSHHK